MPRKVKPTVPDEEARLLGGLLRDLRKAAGYRAVKDAAAAPRCPAAQQTIYAYERGGLVPSLPQFLELVEFYAGGSSASRGLRFMAVAAVHRALGLEVYSVRGALELVERLQPPPSMGRRRSE